MQRAEPIKARGPREVAGLDLERVVATVAIGIDQVPTE
jgi:hypothetical protein